MPDPIILSVPDMSCGHCRASITEALSTLGASGEFDMEARRVSVLGAQDLKTLIDALDDIGFPATPVQG